MTQAEKADRNDVSRPAKGRKGEVVALTALEQAGYEIVECNWRCPLGEVDIVARQGGDLVFVEVRSSAGGIDTALESVARRKRAQLARLAEAYLNEHGLADTAFRIDVVAVTRLASGSEHAEIIQHAVGW